MSFLEQVSGSTEVAKHSPDKLQSLMAAGVGDLKVVEKLEGLTAGDPDAVKIEGFLSGKVVEAAMNVKREQVIEARENLKANSNLENELGSTPEQITTALDHLETLAIGNLETSKSWLIILLAVFAPKKGIPALVKSGSEGVSAVLQGIYTNAEIIANISVEARMEGLKKDAFEKAKDEDLAAGRIFYETEYKDALHLRLLSGLGKILDHSVLWVAKTEANVGMYTMEAVESVLHKTNLLSADKSFTAESPELVEIVTKNGLSPLEKRLLTRFLREIIVVSATQQLKEAITGGHINGIQKAEHGKEVDAAGIGANDDSEVPMAA